MSGAQGGTGGEAFCAKRRRAPDLAKSMTEKYERTWDWIGAPKFPMARPWEKLLGVK